jgi:hypothetical protein
MRNQPVRLSFVQESKFLWNKNIVLSKVTDLLKVYYHTRNATNSENCIVTPVSALFFYLLLLRETG